MYFELIRDLGRSRKLGAAELGLVAGSLEDPGVHVTVVCVAQYECPGLNNGYLTGAVASADRLVDFWQSGQIPRRERLASISLFVSAPPRCPSKHQHKSSPATYALIESHLLSLRARVRPEDSLIIHWIGHGESFGQEGGLIRGVFTSDLDRTGQVSRIRGIDVGGLWASFASQMTSNVLMTVDACAMPATDGLAVFGNPLGASFRPGKPKHVLGLFAAAEKNDTICVGIENTIEDDLLGGSLYSEAIRLALEGFGATKYPGDVAVVYPEGLKVASEYHHKRMQRRYEAKLSEPEFKGDVRANRKRLTEPSQPRSIVQLFEKTGSYADAVFCSCSVTGGKTGSDPVHASWSEVDDCWELNLPQTEGRDLGYRGRLTKGDLLGPEQEFGAVEPITTVFLGAPQ